MQGRLKLLKHLVDFLPRTAALHNAVLPGAGEWGPLEYMTLGILRVLEFQSALLLAGLPVEGKLPPTWPVKVPGEEPEESRPRNRLKELAAWLVASQRG